MLEILRLFNINLKNLNYFWTYHASAVSGERLLSLVEPNTPTLSLPHPSSGLPVLDDIIESLLGLTADLLAWAFCRLKPRVVGGFVVSFAFGCSFSIIVVTFCGWVDTRSPGSSEEHRIESFFNHRLNKELLVFFNKTQHKIYQSRCKFFMSFTSRSGF